MTLTHARRGRMLAGAVVPVVLVAALLDAGAAGAAGSYTETATIAVGNGPVAVAVNPTTHTAYAVNQTDRSVSVIDEAAPSVTATIPVGYSPFGIAVDPGRQLAFVTNQFGNAPDQYSGSISVIDTVSNTVTRTIDYSGIAFPSGIDVDPASHTLYVTDQFTNTVAEIDELTGVFGRRFPTGGNPTGVAVDPGAQALYVANNQGTVATYVDLASGSTAPIATGGGQFTMAVDRTNHFAYVGANQGLVQISGTTVLRRTPLGNSPIGIAVDPAEHTAFVASPDASGVFVVNTDNGQLVEKVDTGKSAYAAAVDTATHDVYIGNYGNNSVSVLGKAPTPTLTRAVVTGLSTHSGSTAGGETVVITGRNFTGASKVVFGQTRATFTVDSDTQITATAPPHTAGTIKVRVHTVGLSERSPQSRYRYTAPRDR